MVQQRSGALERQPAARRFIAPTRSARSERERERDAAGLAAHGPPPQLYVHGSGAPHPPKAGYPGVLPRACGRALCCCIRFRLHRRQRAASGSVCHGAPRRATTTTRPRRTRTHGSRRRARHASCARVGSHGAPRLSWGPTGRWFTRRGTGLLDWMLHTTRPSAITS